MTKEIKDEMKEETKELASKSNQILAGLNSLAAKLDVIEQQSSKRHFEQKRFKDIHHEKQYYKDFPTSDADDPCFKEKFLNLVKGLDKESVRQVSQIIYRLKSLKAAKDDLLPEFTEDEIEKITYIKNCFDNDIIRLSENCFFYDGYVLPNARFEPCIFLDGCSTKHLEVCSRFENKDIIDAGAYIGDTSLIFSKMTSGKVYAFEPTEKNYQDMLSTIKMNGLDNVVPCKLGLGDKKGKMSMTNALVSSSNAFVEKSSMPYMCTEEVDVVTLDDFVKEHNLQVGLIKTDVEGAEQMLLEGAMQTICAQKPSLLISIYHNASDFYTIKPMLENLNLGYEFKIRHPTIGTILMETMLIAEVKE